MRRRVLESALGLWVDPQSAFTALYGHSELAFWLDCGPDATTGVSAMGAATSAIVDSPGEPALDSLRTALLEHGDVEHGVVEHGDGAHGEDLQARGFRLGWVGWLGYELRASTMGEAHGRRAKHPDAVMLRVDRAIVFDHAAGTVTLLALGDRWSGELEEWRRSVHTALIAPARLPPPAHVPVPARVTWAHSDEGYLGMIDECLAAIRDGDAFQLCLTTSAEVDGRPDPLAAYLALRASSPAHHGGYLRFGEVAVLSASPEQFLAVSGGVVETRPIKGTRARGADAASDAALALELRESAKEQAENLMIVDLMRNDLSRVCVAGSVEVPSLLAVESYAHVHQLVSTVRGTLRPALGAIDVIEACFPAGSMTGAPKREATRILDRLEQRPRGIYSGVFGYLGFDGRLDLAMVIRTIVIDRDGATVGAGGGITALSDPAEELAEVKLKAAALLRVLVGDGDGGEPASGEGARRVSA